ncbi:MAG: lytic transglycosylase domain-containing protein [Leptospiraceae bacterium]|nr:lytic transglycosylase domain-containing protein [Leptospiraceae bacterium]MDW7976635.1 lytic transglycosylase domain-containing protein [Leptospiraceae bacterium]
MWKLIVLFFFAGVSLYGVDSELIYYLRSSQWKAILEYFKKKEPLTREHAFLYAKALEKDKENNDKEDVIEVVQLYLQSTGIHCPEKDKIIQCLKTYKHVENTVNNFSLLRASEFIKKSKEPTIELQLEILKKANFQINNTITRTLFRSYLQLIYNHWDAISEEEKQYALFLISQYPNLRNPLINLFIGRIYQKKGEPQQAIPFYIEAALQTRTEDLPKIVWEEIKKSLPVNYYRYTTCFYFSPEAREYLSKFSMNQIVITSTSQTFFCDGKFLLKQKEYKFFLKLLQRGYSYITQNPEILENWLKELLDDKAYSVVHDAMKHFQFLKTHHQNIWKLYLKSIEALKEKNQSFEEIYFDELLQYLNHYHYDTQGYDQLMEFLLIRKDQDYEFRDSFYWEKAYQKLPRQTEAGRFFYWYYVFLKTSQRDLNRAQIILENFYSLAPGSYYIQNIWDEVSSQTKDISYSEHWYRVNSISDYHRWIVYHGYKDEALLFLSKRNLSFYYDSKAIDLQNSLFYARDVYTPEEVLFLLRFKEYEFAFEFFRDYYKETHNHYQYLRHLVIAGYRSENRFVEVHALRQLTRYLGIPEDPFRLPPHLLQRLYPRPYRDIVKKYERMYGVSEDIIYALMRQESMFREDAVSRSGAIGLMQIIPRTGEWLNAKLKIPNYDLYHPEVSIHLGTKFFSDLLKMYDNDFRWAAIAYNGGPGNLRKWKQKYYQGDFNYFLEILPVQESRNYCRKTYQNYLHYKISRILYDQGIK